ncbi:MAG TPA: hypothetical protein VFN77_01310, partial [Acetobacteraceae bacterium]|nr:hypothetical protein [Acetobacteraceae bacterium]
DHYSEELRALIEQKSRDHQPLPAEEEEKPRAQVIDLVEALRRSVAQNSKNDSKNDGESAESRKRGKRSA